jgi:transposase
MEARVRGVVDEVVGDRHVVGVHQADPGRREEVVTDVGHDVVADRHVPGALGAVDVYVHPPAGDDPGGGQVVEEVAGDGDVLGSGQQLQSAAAHLAHGVVGEGDAAGVGQLDLTGHLAAVTVVIRILEGVVRVLRLRLRAADEPVARQQPVAVLERDAVERDRARLRGRAGPGHVHQRLHHRHVRPGLVDVLSRPRVVVHRAIREHLRKRGIRAVIPVPADQRSHRLRRGSRGGRPPAFDRETYKQRNTVERCINRLKQWRGIATRYEKTATIYLAGLHVAGIFIWSRPVIQTKLPRPGSPPGALR